MANPLPRAVLLQRSIALVALLRGTKPLRPAPPPPDAARWAVERWLARSWPPGEKDGPGQRG